MQLLWQWKMLPWRCPPSLPLPTHGNVSKYHQPSQTERKPVQRWYVIIWIWNFNINSWPASISFRARCSCWGKQLKLYARKQNKSSNSRIKYSGRSWVSNGTPTLLAGAGEGELKLGYKLETLGCKLKQTIIKTSRGMKGNWRKTTRIIKSLKLSNKINWSGPCFNKQEQGLLCRMFFNRDPERTYTSHANQVKMLDKIKDSCKNSDVLFQGKNRLV